MTKKIGFWLMIALVVVVFSGAGLPFGTLVKEGWAAVPPPEINFQGRLRGVNPMPATINIRFTTTGNGSSVTTRTGVPVDTTTGVFNTTIDYADLTVFDTAIKPTLKVDVDTGNGYQTLLPAQELVSVPYAFRAAVAERGAPSFAVESLMFHANDAISRTSSGAIYLGYHNTQNLLFYTGSDSGLGTEKMRITPDGNVGIGLSDPSEVLATANSSLLPGYISAKLSFRPGMSDKFGNPNPNKPNLILSTFNNNPYYLGLGGNGAGTPPLLIKDDGNISIVGGLDALAGQVRANSVSTQTIWASQYQNLPLGAGAWAEDYPNNKVYMVNTGRNLGVGTASPAAKFQVNDKYSTYGSGSYPTTAPVASIACPVGGAGSVVDALQIDCSQNTNFDKGVAISLGQMNPTYGHYTSRIVHYGYSAAHTGSRLQLQTHKTSADTWNTGILLDESGNVGIGTASPQAKLEVVGPISGGGYGVVGSSMGNTGILGEGVEVGAGVAGSSTNSYGIYGFSASNVGMYGQSTNNIGVKGTGGIIGVHGKGSAAGGSFEATAGGSIGVRGKGSWGVYGVGSSNAGGVIGKTSDSTSTNVTGFGVYGEGSNYGVYGKGGTAGGSFESTSGFGITSIAPKSYFSGKVGIGLSNPAAKLDVFTTNVQIAVQGIANSHISYPLNYGGYFEADGASGRGAVGSASGATGRGVEGFANGVSGTGVYGRAGGSSGIAVRGEASGVLGDFTTYGGYFTAVTDQGRAIFGSAPRYGGYLTATGNSGSGIYANATSTNNYTNYGGYFVASGVTGRGVFGQATGTSGIGIEGKGESYDFYASGPGTNYGAASSVRWKNNARSIPAALDKVINLRGVYFDWDQAHGGQHDMGMIAEDVGKVVPEVVAYESDKSGYASGMDYGKLTPILVEAIKDLKAKNDNLETRVKELEAKINK